MDIVSQYIFSCRSADEKMQLVRLFMSKGYANTHEISEQEPAVNHVHALCADVKSKSFFYINATCAAARAQAGLPFYKVEDCETVLPEIRKK